jgi:hypothetical protein
MLSLPFRLIGAQRFAGPFANGPVKIQPGISHLDVRNTRGPTGCAQSFWVPTIEDPDLNYFKARKQFRGHKSATRDDAADGTPIGHHAGFICLCWPRRRIVMITQWHCQKCHLSGAAGNDHLVPSLEPGWRRPMKRYVIERDLPGVGGMNREQLKGAAATSNAALDRLAGKVQWVHSYVVDDKTFCIYLADNAETVMKHAEASGFPANKVTEVRTVIEPLTAD